MSTATNTIEQTDDYDFHLYVDNKAIVARVIDSHHPELQIPEEYWEHVSGASLWGFLRRHPIDRVLITQGPEWPARVVVLMADGEEDTAYFYISQQEFRLFLNYFCGQNEEQVKMDWRQAGF